VTYEQGAILEPTASVVHAVERSVRSGDSVLITGAGPIGQLATLVSAAAGASEIFVSEPNQARREQAQRLGVTAVFDPTRVDVAKEVIDRTWGIGVDATIECSGSQPALDAAVAATRAAGTVAQIAIHVGPRTVVPEAWTWKDLTIAGIWSFKFYDTPRILRQIASGKLPVEKIVTSKIKVVDVVSRGIEGLADPMGNQIKILVEPHG
jgi:(R,R)-butanediol dehydrogenase/meso-butanediol dehydrogenase/diacetyl reductase